MFFFFYEYLGTCKCAEVNPEGPGGYDCGTIPPGVLPWCYVSKDSGSGCTHKIRARMFPDHFLSHEACEGEGTFPTRSIKTV